MGARLSHPCISITWLTGADVCSTDAVNMYGLYADYVPALRHGARGRVTRPLLLSSVG